MKKAAVVTLALALLMSIVMVAPAASAQPKKALRCKLWMQLYWTEPLHWEGSLTGDIVGSIIVTEGAPSFPGKTEHFTETFAITTADGTIEGFDEGVWSFQTFKWRANGMVTAATGDWAYLVGYNVHEIGLTTPVPPLDDANVYAWGTITLVHG